MVRNAQRNSTWAALSSLGWPLMLGAAASSGFYILLHRGPLQDHAQLVRYFASHPVSYCATVMFFAGLAALVLKLREVVAQLLSLGKISFPAPPDANVVMDEVPRLLDALRRLPAGLHDTYLARRLRDALDWVAHKGSAAGLDDELKYLADLDTGRQQESYALVRIIIWATPMLGFLGTVMGITQALGDLGSQSDLLATDPKTAMQGLLAGLYVAFDTTALALSLSIVLMFIQFLVDRLETHLLVEVDRRVTDELTGRIVQEDDPEAEPHLAAVRKMSAGVLQAAQTLVQQQTTHWQQVMEQANHKWGALLQSSGDQVRQALSQSLEQSIERLSERLTEAEQRTDDQLRARWEQWQTALSDNARQLHAQQVEMTRQSEMLQKALQATADIRELEHALNSNLQALAGAQHFEETVMSLSAAIQLLSARMGQQPGASVHLAAKGQQEKAA